MPDRDLVFDVIINTTIALDERKEYPLFKEIPSLASTERLTSVGEVDLVKWMLNKDSRRECFFGKVLSNLGSHYIIQTIAYPVIQNGESPGDVDILVFPKDRSEESIAFEVKRVKVHVEEDDEEKVNKDEQVIKKGIKQANQLRSLGFHQTYLVIIIVTDGKNRITKDMPFRYADSDRVRKLYDTSFNKKLHEGVGVIFVHVSEPSSASVDFIGHFAVCNDKTAIQYDQSNILTERIKVIKELYELKRKNDPNTK